jgi:hypothetical protein
MRDLQLSSTNSPLTGLVDRLNRDELEINPACQRGEVWGDERKKALIRSITIGLPIGSIFLDEREYPAWPTVIDGKQRILAVRDWLAGKLRVPAEWFEDDMYPNHVTEVAFTELSPRGRRFWSNQALVQVYWSRFKGTPDEVDAQELELFELINFGGVPQGESDHA